LALVIGTASAQPGEPAATVLLTNAAQVRALTTEEAARHQAVRLRGVFLGETEPGGRGCVIMDETEGIYLHGPPGLASEISRGDLVEVDGRTDPGGFAPFVVAQTLRKLGRGQIPEPRRVMLGELSDLALDAQWVEVSGVVRSCEPLPASELPTPPPGTPPVAGSGAPGLRHDPIFKMELGSGSERVAVQLNAESASEAHADAEVRLQGICFSQHNSSRQFLGPLLLVPRAVRLVIEKPPPPAPFDAPPCPVASLLQFARRGNLGHRVHVRGVVTHHRPGEFLWLREGDHGLRVESKQDEVLQAGDVVDVLGFPARGQYTPVLEDAVFRKRGSSAPPQPIRLTNTLAALKHDADLVELEARLTERHPIRDGWGLALDWGGAPTEALVRLPEGTAPPANWLVGSRVRVTGICSVLTEKSGPVSGIWEPRSFQLLLRSPADLSVIEPPSWWTHRHLMLLLGMIAGGSLLATAIVMVVARWRLREQATRRAMAESEFAAILSERNRMAREIHDTLAQGLVATSVQLRLAKKQAGAGPEAMAKPLDTAQELIRASLEEARNSIWNMRSHVLETNDLAGALNGILKQLSNGTGMQTSLEVTGRARRFAPVIENNLLRVGQEAITNATRHAQARRIAVRLEFAEKQFRLSVSDDGEGFDTAHPPSSEGGFGLVGMRERTAQLNGELSVRSAPGQGTEIRLWVPLSGE